MGINIYLLDVPLFDFVFMEPLLCTIGYLYPFLILLLIDSGQKNSKRFFKDFCFGLAIDRFLLSDVECWLETHAAKEVGEG